MKHPEGEQEQQHPQGCAVREQFVVDREGWGDVIEEVRLAQC